MFLCLSKKRKASVNFKCLLALSFNLNQLCEVTGECPDITSAKSNPHESFVSVVMLKKCTHDHSRKISFPVN